MACDGLLLRNRLADQPHGPRAHTLGQRGESSHIIVDLIDLVVLVRDGAEAGVMRLRLHVLGRRIAAGTFPQNEAILETRYQLVGRHLRGGGDELAILRGAASATAHDVV